VEGAVGYAAARRRSSCARPALGTYMFAPINFLVKKGDFVALAALGGSFNVLVPAPGAVTDMFQGHNMDMNGSMFMSNNTRNGQQLDMQMTLKPTAPGG
jgi:hypothetical protein